MLIGAAIIAPTDTGGYSVAMRRLIDILLVAVVLILIVTGQYLAKAGAGRPPLPLFESLGFLTINGLLLGSYAAFLVRGLLWSAVLRRRPVSQVYPYLSLAYPAVLAVGIAAFGEELTIGKMVGTLLIIAGSMLLVSGGRS